ncbi:TPA: LOW QUALITY PROTEIN: hypothetical protein N0F65_002746, partial [Lagenidium giganteum]
RVQPARGNMRAARGRPISRLRSAHGHLLLHNPQHVPKEGATGAAVGSFSCHRWCHFNRLRPPQNLKASMVSTQKACGAWIVCADDDDDRRDVAAEAAGGLADVMISQRKGEFPPIAFMVGWKRATERRGDCSTVCAYFDPDVNTVAILSSSRRRWERAEKAFQHAFVIVVLPLPEFHHLQHLHIQRGLKLRIMTGWNSVLIHDKHSFELAERAQQLNQQAGKYDFVRSVANSSLVCEQMAKQLQSREHAMEILALNFPFLSVAECDMLLDLFGSIAAISQATAPQILDVSVLSTDAAHAIEEFFRSEYVLE